MKNFAFLLGILLASSQVMAGGGPPGMYTRPEMIDIFSSPEMQERSPVFRLDSITITHLESYPNKDITLHYDHGFQDQKCTLVVQVRYEFDPKDPWDPGKPHYKYGDLDCVARDKVAKP
jgi:hypothetical protein